MKPDPRHDFPQHKARNLSTLNITPAESVESFISSWKFYLRCKREKRPSDEIHLARHTLETARNNMHNGALQQCFRRNWGTFRADTLLSARARNLIGAEKHADRMVQAFKQKIEMLWGGHHEWMDVFTACERCHLFQFMRFIVGSRINRKWAGCQVSFHSDEHIIKLTCRAIVHKRDKDEKETKRLNSLAPIPKDSSS